MKSYIPLVLGVWLLCLPNLAFSTPSSHEIMLKIAAEQMNPVATAAVCSMSLPKNWSVVTNSPEKLQFKVPYHSGVLGVVEKLDNALSSEEAVKKLSDSFSADFSILTEEAFAQGPASGRKLILSARLGGEKWKFLVFSGRLGTGAAIFYYAAVPEYWFASYLPLLMDVIESFNG